MKTRIRKILALLLCLVMVVGMVPTAWAGGEEDLIVLEDEHDHDHEHDHDGGDEETIPLIEIEAEDRIEVDIEIENGNLDRNPHNSQEEVSVSDPEEDKSEFEYNKSIEKNSNSNTSAKELIAFAEQYYGVPYVSGGISPSGFDCCGFVYYVFTHFGYDMPRHQTTQINYGTAVAYSTTNYNTTLNNLSPGDLVFFNYIDASGAGYSGWGYHNVDHVGIYLGDGLFINATGSGIAKTNLANEYWPDNVYNIPLWKQICGVRRVLSNTVTLLPCGGSCDTTTLSVEKGQAIGTLPTPTLDGYYFSGWYTKPYGGTEVTSSTIATESMTLYAHWWHGGRVLMNYNCRGGTIPDDARSWQIDGFDVDWRAANNLVIFQQKTTPGTNENGAEFSVNSAGRIIAYRPYGSTSGLTVPAGGFVVSGHGDDAGTVRYFLQELHDDGYQYIGIDYETGLLSAYRNYAAYLAGTKRLQESDKYGELPVPEREGYYFDGWYIGDYYTGSTHVATETTYYAGNDLYAHWVEIGSVASSAAMTYNGHTYERFDLNMTWEEAKAFCEQRGGHLVTITDADENEAVKGLLSGCPLGMYYIGATDARQEGTWEWVTGESFSSYNNWDTDYQEGNNGTDENCSAMIGIENPPNKQVGEWIDTGNDLRGRTDFYRFNNCGFICEIEKVEYTVTYDANGGTGAPAAQTKTTDVPLTLSSTVPSRTGYTFLGWATSKSATTAQYQPGASYTQNADLTLYAVWRPYEYQISFDANGGTGAPAAQTKYYGTALTLSATQPTRPCHVFLGWATSKSATTAQYQPGGSFTTDADTTLYAVWAEGTQTEWSTTKPTGVDESFIETKTQYRYADKETTTSDQSTLSGWTLYDTQTSWSDWGDWSEWSNDSATASDSRQVETRTAYAYYYYVCSSCGAHMHGYGTCYSWAGGCGKSTISSGSYTRVYITTPYSSSSDFHGTGVNYVDSSYGRVFAYTSTSSQYYTAPVTQYRYRTRTQITTYYFYRWGAWSDWSDTVYTASDNRKVETRTMYRYVQSGDVHQWDDGKVTKAATCTEKGVMTYTCSKCGKTKTDEIAATGHSWGTPGYTWSSDYKTVTAKRICSKDSSHTETETVNTSSQVTTAASCTTKGKTTYTATFTNSAFAKQTKTVENIAALGHSWGEWEVTTPATVDQDGVQTRTCSRCGETETRSYTADTVTITYDANGGSVNPASVKILKNGTISSLPTPTRAGYIFNGWFTSASGGTKVTTETVFSADTTIYAQWMTGTYTVNYDANGGTGAPAAQTKTHDVALTLSDDKPTRADASAGSYTVTLNANGGSVSTEQLTAARTTSYTFKDWNTAADGSGTSYASGASYTANAAVTLYAQWNSTTTAATVTLPTPTRTGYTFKGWATSSTATVGSTGSYKPAGDVTLYAVWSANSVNKCGDNLTWTLEDGILTISGTGDMWNWNQGRAPWSSNASSIREVVLEPGVMNTGKYAFYGCGNLTKVTIPEGVTSIGEGSFQECDSLTSVVLPDTVTSIGRYAFYSCSALTNAVIPEGVTVIEKQAFYGSALTSVTIPSTTESIGEEAFAFCRNMSSLVISDGVDTIGVRAFYYCSSLTSVTIPASVTSIGGAAFRGNSSLLEFAVAKSNPAYCSEDGVLFDKGKTELIQYPAAKPDPTYAVPSGVTIIDGSAFDNCGNLKTLTMPESLTSVGFQAFAYCVNLESLTLPDGLTTIGDQAFIAVKKPTELTIPASVTSIGEYAFSGCKGLTEITFKGTAPAFGTGCFADVTATAYYPADDDSWTEDVRQDYLGTLTWVPYSEEAETYTVTYDANGGTGAPEAQTKTHDVALTLSDAKPTRADASAGSYTVTLDANGGSVSTEQLTAARTTSYTFKDWNTAADGSGTSYASGASYTANAAVTLYAQWNSTTTTAAVTLPTPTRTGYTFKGWATSSTAAGGTTGSYTPAGNVTLYAVWETQADRPTFRVSEVRATAGKQVEVPVKLENNPGIFALTVSFSYDSSALKLVAVTPNTEIFPGTWQTASLKGATWASNAGDISANDTILTLSFEVLEGTEDGEYEVGIILGEIINEDMDDIDFAAEPGKVIVSSHIPGDVNGDGKVSTKDFVTLMKYLSGEDVYVVEDALDVNGDGKVSTKDFVTLMKYLSGEDIPIY